MSKRSVYIADSYSMNTGDVGILQATLQVLSEEMDDVDFIIESSHPDVLATMIDSSEVVYPRIFDISSLVGGSVSRSQKLKAFVSGAYDSLMFLLMALSRRIGLPALWLVRPSRRDQARAIINANLWLSSGGGFISSYYHLEFRFYGFLLAYILRIPVVVFAQSVGPFLNSKDRWLARIFLNRVEIIMAREKDSYEYLQKLQLRPPIRLTSDIAFSLRIDKNETRDKNEKIAICVKSAGSDYNNAIVEFVKSIKDYKNRVVLVSQTPNDDNELGVISQQLDFPIQAVPFGLSPKEIKALYAQCTFIVASRMHAIVFASERGVPWIGIGYEPKFKGLVESMGYDGQLLLSEQGLRSRSLVDCADIIAHNRRGLSELLIKCAKEFQANSRDDVKAVYRILNER